jgi:hypothetical protein
MNNFHITDHTAWRARARVQELLLEAERQNEVTRALNSDPLPETPKPALLMSLIRLLPRLS